MRVVFVFVHLTTTQFSIRKKKKKKKVQYCILSHSIDVTCELCYKERKKKKIGLGWGFFFFFFAFKIIYFSHNDNNKTLVLKFGVRSTMDLNNEVLFLSQIGNNFKTWD